MGHMKKVNNFTINYYVELQSITIVVRECPILGQQKHACVVQCYIIEVTCILYNTGVKFTVNKSQIFCKFLNSGNPKIVTTPRCHIGN